MKQEAHKKSLRVLPFGREIAAGSILVLLAGCGPAEPDSASSRTSTPTEGGPT